MNGWLVAMAAGLFALATGGCRSPASEPLVCFCVAGCASCADAAEEAGPLSELHALARKRSGIRLEVHRISDAAGLDVLYRTFSEKKVPRERQALPALLVGDRFYTGAAEVEAAIARLRRQALRLAGPRVSTSTAPVGSPIPVLRTASGLRW